MTKREEIYLELRDEEFAKNSHVAFKSGALKVAFKEA